LSRNGAPLYAMWCLVLYFIGVYTFSAEAGNPDAAVNLGQMYHKGDGVTKDLVKARRFWTTAAEAGDPHAALNLGIMYIF
jgi:TPR repeat protein